MAGLFVVESSRAIPVAAPDAFARTLTYPLPTLFRRRYAALPPIKDVRDQDGEWASPGQTRTIVLADGGSMVEQLTSVEAPRAFTYELTQIKGALAPLTARVAGAWEFAPAGTGTTVTWRWSLEPRNAISVVGLPVFGRMWRGYARQALEELSDFLTD